MRKTNTETVAASSPTWETLGAFARQGMQQLLQRMLEEEVDGVLGRSRYERRDAVDAASGYRNGFGKPRRLSLSSGTITPRRPRVRGLDERFESRLLPPFKRRTEEVGRLLPELYLHGLAQILDRRHQAHPAPAPGTGTPGARRADGPCRRPRPA